MRSQCRLLLPLLPLLPLALRPRYGAAGLAGGFFALLAAALPLSAQDENRAAALREEAVLRDAVRYLKLSRTQIGRIQIIADQSERRRVLVEQDLERTRRALEAQPELGGAERVAQLMERRRAEGEARIVTFASPLVLRLLTREQIGLIWRLTQGSPPAYAQASEALLDGTAGFVSPALGKRTRLFHGELQGAEEQLLLLRGAEAAGEAERLQEHLNRAYRRLELPDIEVLGRAPRAADEPQQRPFPQRVAESRDTSEFLPEVQPFIRRLFTSPLLFPVLQDLAARGVSFEGPRLPADANLRLVRDYDLERGLRDLTGQGPELEPLGGQLARGAYVFGAGQGLRLADLGVSDHYALEFTFRHVRGPEQQEEGEGYRKLIDFKNREKDGGLYSYQGHLTFYTLASGGVPIPGQDHRLRVERNRATRIVRVFMDWRPIFAFLDLDDEAVFEKRTGLLFVDDATTKDEQGPGAIRWLKCWSTRAAGG